MIRSIMLAKYYFVFDVEHRGAFFVCLKFLEVSQEMPYIRVSEGKKIVLDFP